MQWGHRRGRERRIVKATRRSRRYPKLVSVVIMTFTAKEETISRIVLLLFTDHSLEFGAVLGRILHEFIDALLEFGIRGRRGRGLKRIVATVERW